MEFVEQKFYYHNDKIQSTDNLHPFEELTGKNVYEVIRVREGIPLFLEDHLRRFRAFAGSVDIPLTDSEDILINRLYQLIDKNGVFDQNIKLIWNKDMGLLAFFTKSSYPPASYYQNGIKTTLLNLEREDPNIKIQREAYQKTVLAEREKTGSYEVLLVDQEGNVTEGSRSNLFLVKGDKLYTSPAKNVLLGIVRSKVVAICQQQQIDIIEQNLPVTELNTVDGAFISGTGNDILPIASIDSIKLDSIKIPVISSIMQEYDRLVKQYIASKKDI